MISTTKQVTKTLSRVEDELTTRLAETHDFTKLRSGQKLDVVLDNPEHLILFKLHGRRTALRIENILQNAIAKFWQARMSEAMVPNDKKVLEKLLEEIVNADKTRYTLVNQQMTKLAINKKLEWVFKVYKNVLNEVKVSPAIIKPISLSSIGADLVDKIVCFDCSISGMEAQQAIPDAYETEKSGRVPIENYRKEKDGAVRDYYYDDFQYYWLEENTKEYSKKKILRKIPGQSFGRFVGNFETNDKVRVIGYYRAIEKDKKSKSPGMDVEIEILNMERLEADTEITISQKELSELKKLADDNPEEFIENITTSYAPHIVENKLPKFALMLAAIGSANLGKYRNHIHLYLVGDPATAKSEMLKFVAKLRYLGVYADAPNASARGLMYSQEDWGKRKILKAGLVVKHELLALDELDKMGDTRQELNTTMEQQFASYHKNPFDIETPINCTIVAGGNPQNGKWVDSKTLMDNLKPIEPELLSRCLIIRVYKSGKITKRMRHILDNIQGRDSVKPIYTNEQLAGLVSHCRKLSPKITPEAETAIIEFVEFFEGIEQSSDVNLSFGIRQEIEVIRISTAIAKLLQRKSVDVTCVRLAVKFLKECHASLGMRTEGRMVEMNLNDQATNRDEAWHQIIRELQKSSDDGCFSESELITKMLEFTMFWKTKDAAHGYWKRFNPNLNKTSDYYEPKPGRYQKVS